MKPMESFSTDEFVSGQNPAAGPLDCLRVISLNCPLFYLSLKWVYFRYFLSFCCINKHVQDVFRYSASVGNGVFRNRNGHWDSGGSRNLTSDW